MASFVLAALLVRSLPLALFGHRRAERASPLLCAAPVKAPVRAAETNMMLAEVQTTVETISSTLATSSGDFGGMTIPIIGLTLLGATIGLLAGPVED